MSFTFKKKCVVFCALAVLTLLAYKTYSEKNELHGNLYKLHKSFVHLYAVPDLWTAEHKKEFTKATWGQLKTRPAFMKSLSKVSEALPLSYEEQTQDQKKEALISLHQSYFLKVRQAAFLVRQSYINIIYSPETTNPYAGYVPKPKIDKKGKDLSFHKSNLQLKEAEVIHKKGEIDYLVIGSGPAGSLIAAELKRKFKGARIVIMESGPFVNPKSMRTDQVTEFLESKGQRFTQDGGILIKNGQVVGGGTTVNIDLAFSPLLPSIRNKLERWTEKGWISPRIVGDEKTKWQRIKTIYRWIKNVIGTRSVEDAEINKNNALLKNAIHTAKTYDLNQESFNAGKNQILKISAVDAFLLPALRNNTKKNSSTLDIIPSAKAHKIVFEENGPLKKAAGVEITFLKPFNNPNIIKDINGFDASPGQRATIKARNVIVSAGALGSATLLLKSNIVNPNIGKGIVLHPSIPVVGLFDHEINVMDGLYASVYAPSEDLSDQYFFESMGDEPSVIAQIIPGFGKEIGEFIKKFPYLGGFGVMLVDSVTQKNHIAIDPLTEEPQIRYQLIESDKNRFRQALKKGIKMLFDQGARKVFIPSLELVHEGNLPIFEAEDDYEKAIDCLQFKPAANFITSAHMQSSNKMGDNPMKSVVDQKFRVWNPETSTYFPNLFVVDSSVFPESIGANPMQSIYTFAKLFIQKLTNKPLVV
tara:strand:- start:7037 stop:9136 length:2100 start_codon:yes stop_codon:yes gene_type:complete